MMSRWPPRCARTPSISPRSDRGRTMRRGASGSPPWASTTRRSTASTAPPGSTSARRARPRSRCRSRRRWSRRGGGDDRRDAAPVTFGRSRGRRRRRVPRAFGRDRRRTLDQRPHSRARDIAAALAAGVETLVVARLTPATSPKTMLPRPRRRACRDRVDAAAAAHGRANLSRPPPGCSHRRRRGRRGQCRRRGADLGTLAPLTRVAAGEVVATIKIIPYAVPAPRWPPPSPRRTPLGRRRLRAAALRPDPDAAAGDHRQGAGADRRRHPRRASRARRHARPAAGRCRARHRRARRRARRADPPPRSC